MTDSPHTKWIAVDPILSGRQDGHPLTMAQALFHVGMIEEAWGSGPDSDGLVRQVFMKKWPRVKGHASMGCLARLRFRLAWSVVVLQSNGRLLRALWAHRKDPRGWIFMNGKNQFFLGMLAMAAIRRKHLHVVWFFDPSNRFHQLAGVALRVLKLKNICFYTETPSMADEYTKRLGAVCRHAIFPLKTKASSAVKEGPLVVAVLGPARIEKGFDLLPQVVAQLADEIKAGKLFFIIQSAHAGDAETEEAMRQLGSATGVRLLSATLSSDDYDQALDDASVVLVPYRKANYARRSSWVTVEAMAAGKPVLMTQGIPACELVAEHGVGLYFEDGDVVGMANGIRQALRDRSFFKKALAKSAIFRENALWDIRYAFLSS